MRTLIIGFSTGRTTVAAAIRLAQGTKYSHVYIRTVSEKWGRSFIYQASGTKCNIITYQRFVKQADVIKEFEIQVSEDVYQEIVGGAMDLSGEDYGVFQLVGLGLVLAVRALTGIRIRNPFKKGFICSEMVARLLKEYDDVLGVADFMERQGLEWDTITPKDIDLLLTRYFRAIPQDEK